MTTPKPQPAAGLTERKLLTREMSAAYFSVSPTIFDEMVADGRAPMPKLINAMPRWDRHALDRAAEALPDRNAKPKRRWGEPQPT